MPGSGGKVPVESRFAREIARIASALEVSEQRLHIGRTLPAPGVGRKSTWS
jgi:hypothetical protein